MKQLFILAAMVGILYFVDRNFRPKQYVLEETTVSTQQPLDIFFLQDCSGSSQQSAAFITSKVFDPLFSCTDRDVRIGFLCITANSAQPPVFVTLPAKSFSAPMPYNMATLSITERKRAKTIFSAATAQYQQDSISYFTDRRGRINAFSITMDSLLNLYRVNRTNATDLVTAIEIGDKTFNSSSTDSRRVICINGDGKDSYGRSIKRLRNKSEVLVINADGYKATSIDSIVTTTVTTAEQAITFLLIKK